MSFVGVDLGSTNLRVGLYRNGKVLKKFKERTRRGSREELRSQIVNLIEKLKAGNIENVCVATIVDSDPEKGTSMGPLEFPENEIRKTIKEEFGTDTEVLNDCTAAVVAENELGAGKGVGNLVYITISSGIGAGVIVDGRLLKGAKDRGAEVGHITIEASSHLEYKQGVGRGHWGAFCSGRNIPKFARYLAEGNEDMAEGSSLMVKGKITAKDVFDEAKNGDKFASFVVKEIGRLNAAGFASVVNAYGPEMITVGGAVALNNPEMILGPMRKYIDEYKFNEVPEIKITPLGEDIVLKGACFIASNPSAIR